MPPVTLESSITVLAGIGPTKARQFEKLAIKKIEDLIFYAPREYVDYSEVTKTSQLKAGKVTIQGHIHSSPKGWYRGRRHMTEVIFEDDFGQVKVVWFNQPYRKRQLQTGREYVVSGELKFYGKGYSIVQPSVERVESERLSAGVVVARYPETKGLNSRSIRKAQKEALKRLEKLKLYPDKFEEETGLIGLNQALTWLHFPKNDNESKTATTRLSFDELFALQLANRLTKDSLKKKKAYKVAFDKVIAKDFVDSLGFKLTDGQRQAAWEILNDIKLTSPMNRLLEGDVGSGKTVVAAMGMLMTAKAGLQSVLLAPTTILASQHFETLTNTLKQHGVAISLLTRHSKTAEIKQVKKMLELKKPFVLVGTHALLSEKINFENLGLVIIDEQHRFGVEDREKLQNQAGQVPHILTMTATPIPRSLALTIYGELDISLLKELPKGRKKITTNVLSQAAKLVAYDSIKTEIKKGNQAYVVAPRIEDTGDDMANIVNLEKSLPNLVGKTVKYDIVHGTMKAEDKENVMEKFYKGSNDVLLGTTVIEVGVDNPNATVMVIEGAERFGLAQLHQLRGRIGRSDKASTCFLVTSQGFEPTRRLNAMKQTTDGFKLAQLDLKIRGPGALYGTRQHGPLDLNIADIEDVEMLKRTAKAVDRFIELGYDVSQCKLLNRRIQSMRKATFLN